MSDLTPVDLRRLIRLIAAWERIERQVNELLETLGRRDRGGPPPRG
jgi:uncharacterized protein YjiS (DUF1127 family)